MKFNAIAMTVLTLAITSAAQASNTPPDKAAEPAWEQLGDGDGITTWRKEVPGSDLVAFKGHAVVEANIAKVAQVLNDTSRKLEWVDSAVGAKDIKIISENERIEYNRTSPPWPIKDRDFVFHAKAELDKTKRTMFLSIKSTTDPAAPETNAVRGEIEDSYYSLACLDEKCTKTDVTVEIHADPKGSIPKWIVNIFQKAWPRNTLEGIRKQVAKPDVQEFAPAKAFFGLT
jgi:hypothetical protein